MSLIIHRCTKCDAPSVYKDHREGCRQDLFEGPSAVLISRSNATGAVVETLAKPGSKFQGFGHPAMDMCDCEECQALFASLGGKISAVPVGGTS